MSPTPVRPATFVVLSAILVVMTASALRGAQTPASSTGGMSGMTGHMYLSTLRALQPGDQKRADTIVADAKIAMEPYQDYHRALADNFHIFLPNIPQPLYHFTNYANSRAANWNFDPLKPTSLLYRKNPDGAYTLIGVMYTDRVTATQDELNDRIPLSIARWHQHVNFCKAPFGEWSQYFGPHPRFGLMGSINTRDACDVAGGVFIPHVLGWMVHVYPYETDPAKIWSIDDDHGHDNMDHSAMPGMNMNN
ncbi:MAG TPA: hypothetical protein VL990_18120 [Acidobacteriaceae bacterium]|nr:hypothetical protein [Acidobacteriaceae bacterium]